MSEKSLNPNELKMKKPQTNAGIRKGIKVEDEAGEKLTVVNLARTAKVVKGGKRFSFRALVVVGDQNGRVGASIGKANQVQLAIQKASYHARKNMIEIPLREGTIPHEIIGISDAGKVWMKPAAPGTGVIAGAGVRAVLEAVGVKNILTKSIGSSNACNLVYATMSGLKNLKSREEIDIMRGKTIAKGFYMICLNNLSPKKGSRKRKMRLGYGPASGKGRSCTKGQKGQTSRSGNTRKESSEGGQMPLIRRIPKSGFSNVRFTNKYECVNLKNLVKYSSSEITPKFLKEKGLVKSAEKIKILGDGVLKSALTISAHSFTSSAKKKIESAGGKAVVVEIARKTKNKESK
jgi:small subunit ribosomal protein S5